MRSPLFLLVTLVLLQVPLAGCGDDVDRYLADLGSRNPMVRLEAAKLARRVDEPRLAAALAPLLTDGSQDIRYNAAVSLAYIGTTEQVPVLIHALGDEDREVRLAVVVGFLGAFTTFSTFSYETTRALEAGQLGLAGVNIATNVLLCVGATVAGLAVGRALW